MVIGIFAGGGASGKSVFVKDGTKILVSVYFFENFAGAVRW